MSSSEGNQTMRFGQFIEYNKRNIFFKNHTEDEAGRVVPVLYEVKASGLQLSVYIFR